MNVKTVKTTKVTIENKTQNFTTLEFDEVRVPMKQYSELLSHVVSGKKVPFKFTLDLDAPKGSVALCKSGNLVAVVVIE